MRWLPNWGPLCGPIHQRKTNETSAGSVSTAPAPALLRGTTQGPKAVCRHCLSGVSCEVGTHEVIAREIPCASVPWTCYTPRYTRRRSRPAVLRERSLRLPLPPRQERTEQFKIPQFVPRATSGNSAGGGESSARSNHQKGHIVVVVLICHEALDDRVGHLLRRSIH